MCKVTGGWSVWAELVPADVLRVGGVGNAPVVDVKRFTELRRLRLLTTATALHLTGVKVLQDTGEGGGGARERGGVRRRGAESVRRKWKYFYNRATKLLTV